MAQTSTDQAQRIRDGYDAFGRGDLEAIRDQFSPDIVWHVGGRGPLAGDYKGMGELFGFFGRIVSETGGTFKNELHDVLTNDTHVVVLLSQSAERNGKKLSTNAVQVAHLDEAGRITESWFVPTEPYDVDEFWA